jgi:hypothetical protein
MCEEADYRAVNVLGMTAFKPEYAANNISCLLLKKLLPNKVYAFGSLHYPDHGVDLDVNPAVYAQFLLDVGFDGIKMLEGKPSVRRRTDMPLNHAYYDSFYHYLEEKNVPILFHVNDPANFWDRENIPPLAVERGDFYGDGKCPSKEAIYHEVDAIIDAHPKLKIIWAHFYFLSEDLERAAHFLDAHPGSYFDITPGPEMFFDFSKNLLDWRNFFEKYSNRIIFGTDNYNPQWRDRVDGMVEFLETDSSTIPFFEKTIRGMSLSDSVLKNIYADNFMNFMNHQSPKEVDSGLLEQEFRLVEKMAWRSVHKTTVLEDLVDLREIIGGHKLACNKNENL